MEAENCILEISKVHKESQVKGVANLSTCAQLKQNL